MNNKNKMNTNLRMPVNDMLAFVNDLIYNEYKSNNDNKNYSDAVEDNIKIYITEEERDLIAEIFDVNNPVDRWRNIHAWLLVDGEIFDPTPVQEHGEIVAYLMGLDLNQPVYKPYNDNKIDKLTNLCEMKMKRLNNKFLAGCFTNPQVGSCYYNAMVYKACAPKEHDVKIQFGSMGWRRKAGGKPFYQWGDNNLKSWHTETEEMNKNFMKHLKKRTKKLRLMLERSPRTDEEIDGMRDMWHGRCNAMEPKY